MGFMNPLNLKFNDSENGVAPEGEKKRSGWMPLVRNLLAVIIILVVFGYIFHILSTNWNELGIALKRANGYWLALHVACVLSYFALLPVVWALVIRTGTPNVPFRASIISGYLPSMGKYVPGKVWTVASRAMLLKKYGNVPTAQAATATFLQYIFELAGAAPFVLIYAYLGIVPFVSIDKIAPFIIPAIIVAVFPGFAWRLLAAISERLRLKINLKITAPTFTPGVYSSFIFQWVTYGLAGVALCKGFSNFDMLTAIGICCAFIASWLIGFISLLTPGGIGVREGAMVLMLTPLIGDSTAVLVSLMARITWTIGDGCGILTGLAYAMGQKNRKE
ncbi:MAG: flippase-like domain-containing protein [Deltaproteobacteria bacterium]|nr:flippase-like domain-containing protein [Deltaproteobacteria bacterium]